MKKFIGVHSGNSGYLGFEDCFRWLSVDNIVNISVSSDSAATTIHFIDTNGHCCEYCRHFYDEEKAYQFLKEFIDFVE